MITLYSERLIVTPLSAQYRQQYINMMSDARVMAFIGEGLPLTRDQALSNLHFLLAQNEFHGYGFWAILLKSDREFIGRIDLFDPDRFPQHELGWTLLPAYWGKGYALEAARLLRDYFFIHYAPQSLISYIQPDNYASVKIARRLGAHKTDDVVISGRHYYLFRYQE